MSLHSLSFYDLHHVERDRDHHSLSFIIITLLHTIVKQVYNYLPLPSFRARATHVHPDSVVMVTTVACALLLFLITLMVTVGYFILKTDTIEKEISSVLTS